MKNDKNKTIINTLVVLILVAVAVISVMLVVLKSERPENPVEEVETGNSFSETSQNPAQLTETEATNETVSQIIQNVTQAEETSWADGETTTAFPAQNETSEPKISDSGRIIVNTEREDWNLIVVNSSREIPEGFVPKLKEILGCGKYLDERVAPYYEKMYYAAKKDGIILTPYSAYRSYERQKINYENLTNTYMSRYNISKKEAAEKAATVILPPGTSEHNLGLAMDICNTYDSFANTKEYEWLTKNAHKYGFILRYTAEKQSITGIVPEPWHWRFVGVEYAEEIKNSGLCLEEWLDSKGIAY